MSTIFPLIIILILVIYIDRCSMKKRNITCLLGLILPINFVSLNIRPCKARSTLVNTNSDETLFYPFTVSVNKYGGTCNTIDDPYASVCVPNKVKNITVKVFNLMSGVNETRLLVNHESCECKCGFNERVCNSKQKRIIMNVGASVKN